MAGVGVTGLGMVVYVSNLPWMFAFISVQLFSALLLGDGLDRRLQVLILASTMR